jgi:hypothetical protein
MVTVLSMERIDVYSLKAAEIAEVKGFLVSGRIA